MAGQVDRRLNLLAVGSRVNSIFDMMFDAAVASDGRCDAQREQGLLLGESETHPT
jgi:hypothetical protein